MEEEVEVDKAVETHLIEEYKEQLAQLDRREVVEAIQEGETPPPIPARPTMVVVYDG